MSSKGILLLHQNDEVLQQRGTKTRIEKGVLWRPRKAAAFAFQAVQMLRSHEMCFSERCLFFSNAPFRANDSSQLTEGTSNVVEILKIKLTEQFNRDLNLSQTVVNTMAAPIPDERCLILIDKT